MKTLLSKYQFIIIGAGIAGLSAIKKIRDYNTSDRILLVHNEDRLPYKRTKINKNIATGFSKDDFSLNSKEWYDLNKVDLLFDEVESIDKNTKEIKTNNSVFLYDKLLIATGAKPYIPLIEGLDTFRTQHVHAAKEVEELIKNKLEAEHFLIIGGGVEGIETADQLVKLGKKVTIIQRSKNPLKHLFPEEITHHIYNKLEAFGINYFEEEVVKSIEKVDSYYEILSTKQHFNVDEIVFCSGSKPDLTIANKAGLETNKGIIVDENLLTSDENIFAAGDVAEHVNGFVTGLWHPAEYQGYAAGANMLGENKPYKEAPYRLKTEVFDSFYFSANYLKCSTNNVTKVKEHFGHVFRELFLDKDRICGLVMMNDKKRSKLYQKAVAEQWSLEQFQTNIPKL